MLKTKIKHKTDLYLAIGFFLFIVLSMGSKYAGVGFPEKEALSYSVGILDFKDYVRHTKHLTLNNVQGSEKAMVFACGYSFLANGRFSDCSFNSLKPYQNHQVTIGWYVPDKFLLFKNDVPQMVTLEVKDKVVISYADTISRIHRKNNTYKYMSLFAFPSAILMYFILVRIGKNYKQRKRVN